MPPGYNNIMKKKKNPKKPPIDELSAIKDLQGGKTIMKKYDNWILP